MPWAPRCGGHQRGIPRRVASQSLYAAKENGRTSRRFARAAMVLTVANTTREGSHSTPARSAFEKRFCANAFPHVRAPDQ